MYVLIEGQAQVTTGQLWIPAEAVGANDPVVRVKDLFEGDSFGEEVIFCLATNYEYTVAAKTTVSMYELSMESFQHQFRNMPDLIQRMYVNLLGSKKQSQHRLSRASTMAVADYN